jgi:hypothetical protein
VLGGEGTIDALALEFGGVDGDGVRRGASATYRKVMRAMASLRARGRVRVIREENLLGEPSTEAIYVLVMPKREAA